MDAELNADIHGASTSNLMKGSLWSALFSHTNRLGGNGWGWTVQEGFLLTGLRAMYDGIFLFDMKLAE